MLLLLRHGQIKANRQGRWHGSTDSPLTWRGRRQAGRTGRWLRHREPPVEAIVSSPLQRCRATAAAAARALALDVTVHEGLREMDLGDWEGEAFEALQRERGLFTSLTHDPDFSAPGGESVREVADRMVPALRELHTARPEGVTLVVSHGVALGVAVAALLDGKPTSWTDYRFQNCSLTQLHMAPTPHVDVFNEFTHL